MPTDPDLIRIGVNRLVPSITQRASDPTTRSAVLLALQRMQRMLPDVQNAIHSLQQALRGSGTAFGTPAPRANKELRDAVLGLVMGVGFVEGAVGASDDLKNFVELVGLAAQASVSGSGRTPMAPARP